MSNFPSIHVRQAAVSDLAALVPLFDGYRQFYGKPSDRGLAHSFLLERFQHHQSVILIATQPDGTVIAIFRAPLYEAKPCKVERCLHSNATVLLVSRVCHGTNIGMLLGPARLDVRRYPQWRHCSWG